MPVIRVEMFKRTQEQKRNLARELTEAFVNTCGGNKDAIKIPLTSPPVDGAANKSCLRFFSKWLEVAPSEISITRGYSSKNKIIKVVGFSEKQFLEILKIKNLLK